MKILVIGLSNLGDALLTYPAMHALWAAYPDAEVHVLASPRTWELFTHDHRVKLVWTWDKKADLSKQLDLLWRLRRQDFDMVVDFRNTLIPFFLGVKRRTPLLRKRPAHQHRAQTHMDLVTGLGVPPYNGPMTLPYEPDDEQEAAKWLEPGKRPVILVPGARSHLKRWLPDRFALIADRLVERCNAQIILIGEESEGPIAESVRRAMKQPVTDRVGKTTLRQLAALLKQTRLMVTNDSACLHAAEAMGVPTVAIFGPTDDKKYGPRNPRSIVMRKKLSCAPCERAQCYRAHECMQWLETDDVYLAALKVLDPKRSL